MLLKAGLVCAVAALTGCAAPYYHAAPPPPPPPPAPLIIIVIGGDAGVVEAGEVVAVEPAGVAAQPPIRVSVPRAAPAPEALPPRPVPLSPRWSGAWEEPDGHRFRFELVLGQDQGGRVEGYFDWELLAAPAGSHLAQHVHERGRELVRGNYDPRARRLELTGYHVSNPRLIATDHYRIVLDRDGDGFQGLSRGSGDSWSASIQGRVARGPG